MASQGARDTIYLQQHLLPRRHVEVATLESSNALSCVGIRFVISGLTTPYVE